MSGSLGTATGRIVINTDDVKRAAAEVKRGSQEMTKALNTIGVGVGLVAVKRLGEMAYELAENAAQAGVTREAFNSLAASFGQNADDMLSAMRTASKGMVSDQNLVLDANRAMLLGVADSAEKMNTLLDISRVRGQAMGLTLTKAFGDLVTGLGRVQPKILDNLGIHGGQEALDAYAKSVGTTADKLSDAQSQAILFNFILKDTKSLLDAAANAGDTAGTKFQQFGAKIENTKKQLGDFLLEAGATDALDTLSDAIDNSVTQLQQMDNLLGELKNLFDGFGESSGLENYLSEVNRELELLQDNIGWIGFMLGQGSQMMLGTRMGLRADNPLATNITTSGPKSRSSSGGRGTSGPVPIPATPIDWDAITKAQADYGKDLAKINRDTNRDIQQATEDAGRQRAETIRSYELGIARGEEDFQIARARQQRDYENSILAIMRDGQAREVKVRADLDANIAQERADSNKQLARQEEDFQTARKRAQRDHSDDLLDAAGDLDAKRVYQLQRDNAKQQKDSQEDHDKQLKRDAGNQAEREAQERKAAQKQIDEGKAADEQRLADMRAALALQRTDEDADRTLRATRAAADQQHTLDQQAEEQGRRIQQIQDNAAEERTALQSAFGEQLTQLHLHNIAYKNKQKELQDQALEDLAPFMKDWFDTVRGAMEASWINPAGKRPGQTPSMVPAGFASGGYIPRDMFAMVHRGEYITPAPAVAAGQFGPSSSSRSVHIGTLSPTIVIGDTGGRSDADIERIVMRGMMKVFEEAT